MRVLQKFKQLLPYLLMLLCGCSLLKRGKTAGLVIPGQLLGNSSFESEEEWELSAPPGYSTHATLSFVSVTAHSGRRCAAIEIQRHPPDVGAGILHGWTQTVHVVPRGRKLRFGGWAKIEGSPDFMFGIEYQVSLPRNGRTVLREVLPAPPADGRFHFLYRELRLPDDTTELVFYFGISSIGRAWFDDVFIQLIE